MKFVSSCILLVVWAVLPLSGFSQSVVIITGQVYDVPFDTISLQVPDPFGYRSADSYNQNASIQTLTAVPDHGHFTFKIKSADPGFYYKIYLSSRREETFGLLKESCASEYLMAEADDSMHIQIDKLGMHFSGRGGYKNECIYQMKEAAARIKKKPFGGFEDGFNYRAEVQKEQLRVLNAAKNKLKKPIYEQMMADVLSVPLTYNYNGAGSSLRSMKVMDSLAARETRNYYCNILNNQKTVVRGTDPYIASRTYAFGLYLLERYNYTYHDIIEGKKQPEFYYYLKKKYSGKLRDKLVTICLKEENSRSTFSEEKTRDALGYATEKTSKEHLREMMDTYKKDSPVLDFPFHDSVSRVVKLSDFKGKVIFVDMWFTGCGGCVAVAKALPQVEKEFEGNADVVFISLSIDRELEQWKKAIRPLGITNGNSTYHYTHYTTASAKYLYTGGTGSNNEFIKKYVPGGAYPHLLIIDRQGRIFSAAPPRPDVDAGSLITLLKKAVNAF